ncbi:MAG: hypothetical protein FIA95_10615 [Gemmatimonadetes bacterium]|nr:hypothetical protein [Gemmatimonadota bacterium]
MSRCAAVMTLAVALALGTAPAAAQVAGAGSKQITFAGGGLVGEDYQSLNGTFGVTRYVSDAFEIGTFVQATLSKSKGMDAEVSGFLFANFTWNFVGQSKTVPFVFFGAGTPLNEDTAGDAAFQGGFGFKRFVNENISFNGQASAIGQKVGDTFEWGDYMLLSVGFSYYIR